MCLAIPAKIIECHEGQLATVMVGKIYKKISIALVKDVSPGDYVIIHVGFALSKLDTREAEKTLALMTEIEDEIH